MEHLTTNAGRQRLMGVVNRHGETISNMFGLILAASIRAVAQSFLKLSIQCGIGIECVSTSLHFVHHRSINHDTFPDRSQALTNHPSRTPKFAMCTSLMFLMAYGLKILI